MCGRFTVTYTYEQMIHFLSEEFAVFDMSLDVKIPRYNMAPGQQVLSIIKSGERYKVGTLKWGFLPTYSTDRNYEYNLINARSEGLAEKSTFKDSLFHRRCLIVSDGFYEWDAKLKTQHPYYITFKDKRLRLYAGIWNKTTIGGITSYTCAIITTQANGLVGKIHDRMPVILDIDKAKKWLESEDISEEYLNDILNQYDESLMEMHMVSSYVNKVKNDDLKCIELFEDYTLF